jgi:hypothetical protein
MENRFQVFVREVKRMISWLWLIPAFLAGEMVGIMAIAIISGRRNNDEHS